MNLTEKSDLFIKQYNFKQPMNNFKKEKGKKKRKERGSAYGVIYINQEEEKGLHNC
jgi:hypothetical protein